MHSVPKSTDNTKLVIAW